VMGVMCERSIKHSGQANAGRCHGGRLEPARLGRTL